MNAKVISMINYKGGVAKTVSTYNIGFGLAFLNSAKVLLVDLDPQCSLSTICLRAVSRTRGTNIDLSQLSEEQTINSVIRDYLVTGDTNPKINLSKLITHIPYTRYNGQVFNNVDFIAATMFDMKNDSYEKGLDDLEIDIVRKYANHISSIDLVTIFSRFFLDTKIKENYDFIIFDCPPANNIITQNALAVSDYYLIPTIMDNISSNGINHLINLIHHSIFDELYKANKRVIDNCEQQSRFYCLKKQPELLGIFETLRKTTVKYNNRKVIVDRYKNKVFEQIIYHHKKTGDAASAGEACFSLDINIERDQYSPHVNYGRLVLEMLKRMGIPKVNNNVTENSWL